MAGALRDAAEAFAALLAAERAADGLRIGRRLAGAAAPVDRPTSSIEQVVAARARAACPTRSCARRLPTIVSATAERLVREEIERIKSNIK